MLIESNGIMFHSSDFKAHKIARHVQVEANVV
jgi:hypothetical protein